MRAFFKWYQGCYLLFCMLDTLKVDPNREPMSLTVNPLHRQVRIPKEAMVALKCSRVQQTCLGKNEDQSSSSI